MAEKFVEMSKETLYKTITEMVRAEVVKSLLESSIPLPTDNDEQMPEETTVDISERLWDALSDVKDSDIAAFAVKFFAAKGLSGAESIKNLADVAKFIEANFSDFKQAMVASEFVTKMKSSAPKAKKTPTFDKFREEEDPASRILGVIHDKLTVDRGKNAGQKTQENFKAFSDWIKRNYPKLMSPTDDTPTTLAKYADFFSTRGVKIPQGKSWKDDLSIFYAARGFAKADTTAFDDEKPEKVDPNQGKYITALGLDDAESVEAIAQAIGASSAKTVTNILRAIPAGKTHALYSLLVNNIGQNDKVIAGRSLKTFMKFFDKSLYSAQQEFVWHIEDALEKGDPASEKLALSDLIEVLDASGLRDELSEDELTYESMGLQRIVQIVNNTDYTDSDWEVVIKDMLKSDMLHSGNNIFKSFQNLMAQELGKIDPASVMGKPGRPLPAEVERRASVQQQFGKYTLNPEEKRKSAKSTSPTQEEPV